jgi:dTDP-L-rhamnose 4-epimerase
LQMRDFVSVHDVVQANMLAMERSAADGQALNVGSGSPITISEVGRRLAEALGSDIVPQLTGKYRAGDIRHCFADISAAQELLGYEPKVQFGEGMRELVEWLRLQSAEDKADEAVERLHVYGLTA